MAIQPWLCLALLLSFRSLSFSAISRADRRARIHGHFPDVDVLRVEWRTAPLQRQIPVPWLARKVHNWSARKIVVVIKRPKLRLLRLLLGLVMRDSAHTQLECGFQSAGKLKVSSKLPKNPGELRRSLQVYAPYSSFQAILQKWEQRGPHPEKDFRKANEFARDCLLWCAEQPMTPMK